MSDVEVMVRPNGRTYRPRRPGLRVQAWENRDNTGDERAGVIVFGTLDPDKARALALEMCTYWYGDADAYQLGDPTPGWWRNTFRYAGRTWVPDEQRGSAGVMFTWTEKPAVETAEEYIARCRRQAMRDHPFVPSDDPRYCGHWSNSTRTGAHGTLKFGSQCGYTPDLHPERPAEAS